METTLKPFKQTTRRFQLSTFHCASLTYKTTPHFPTTIIKRHRAWGRERRKPLFVLSSGTQEKIPFGRGRHRRRSEPKTRAHQPWRSGEARNPPKQTKIRRRRRPKTTSSRLALSPASAFTPPYATSSEVALSLSLSVSFFTSNLDMLNQANAEKRKTFCKINKFWVICIDNIRIWQRCLDYCCGN